MRTLRTFVMVVLMIYSVMGVALAEEVEEDESVMAPPAQPCGDANVATLKDGGPAIRRLVSTCATSPKFRMPAPVLELVLRHIPVRFDLFNARPRGCVEIDMTVEEIRSRVVQRSWQVIVDVDNKTQTQNAHYGYTIMGIKPKIPKATGHVFFPPNVIPPNVRPFLGESKGQIVHFADRKNGPPANTQYKLSGVMYNQYKSRLAPDDDNVDNIDDIAVFTDI